MWKTSENWKYHHLWIQRTLNAPAMQHQLGINCGEIFNQKIISQKQINGTMCLKTSRWKNELSLFSPETIHCSLQFDIPLSSLIFEYTRSNVRKPTHCWKKKKSKSYRSEANSNTVSIYENKIEQGHRLILFFQLTCLFVRTWNKSVCGGGF